MLNIALSALFLGLAVLTKGPVAVTVFFICLIIFLLLRRFKLKMTFRRQLFFQQFWCWWADPGISTSF